MVMPVIAYGHPVLKKVGKEIDPEYPKLDTLIENMWETMYNAKGIGLAAPQVGLSIRMFMVDTAQIKKDDDEGDETGIKKVFINAKMLDESGEEWAYEEGCLSIPNINGDVSRKENIKISYYDENFVEHIEEYDGMNARVIQHEYDHIEGKLFVDKLSPLKRRMIQRKLDNIRKGKARAEYSLRFA